MERNYGSTLYHLIGEAPRKQSTFQGFKVYESSHIDRHSPFSAITERCMPFPARLRLPDLICDTRKG